MIDLGEKLKVVFNKKSSFYKYSRVIVVIAYIVYFIILGFELRMKFYHILYPAILIGMIDGITYYASGDSKKSKETITLVAIAIVIVLITRFIL